MKFRRLAYMGRPSRRDTLRPHDVRDGDSFACLIPLLIRLGYELGELVLNHPPVEGEPDGSLASIAGMGPADLLVFNTRPPLDDKTSSCVQRILDPSGNRLEQECIFPAVERYIRYCTRSEIKLTNQAASLLLHDYRNRTHISYYVKPHEAKERHEASYEMLPQTPGCEKFERDHTTAGYLIHTAPIVMPGGELGPRLLLVFGLSGTTGLAFAHQLAVQRIEPFPDLLRDALLVPSLSLIEITTHNSVPRLNYNLDFSDQWTYKLITARPGHLPSAPAPAPDSRQLRRGVN